MIRLIFDLLAGAILAAFATLGLVTVLALPETLETIIAALDRIEARLEETCR